MKLLPYPELATLLRAHADAAMAGGYADMHHYLATAAVRVETHYRSAVMRTIIDEHDVNDYEQWMRCGAMLKATGFSEAFATWLNWSAVSYTHLTLPTKRIV